MYPNMNRANFLKSFGVGAAGLIIPNTLLTQKPIKVYENYLKGTSYYKVDKHKNKLNEGDELRLEREATNPYDSFAISVHYQQYKLGYVAAYENIVLANLFDQNRFSFGIGLNYHNNIRLELGYINQMVFTKSKTDIMNHNVLISLIQNLDLQN